MGPVVFLEGNSVEAVVQGRNLAGPPASQGVWQQDPKVEFKRNLQAPLAGEQAVGVGAMPLLSLPKAEDLQNEEVVADLVRLGGIPAAAAVE